MNECVCRWVMQAIEHCSIDSARVSLEISDVQLMAGPNGRSCSRSCEGVAQGAELDMCSEGEQCAGEGERELLGEDSVEVSISKECM